jgi:hypothetical protein
MDFLYAAINVANLNPRHGLGVSTKLEINKLLWFNQLGRTVWEIIYGI